MAVSCIFRAFISPQHRGVKHGWISQNLTLKVGRTKNEKNQDFNHKIQMRQVWLWAVFIGHSSQPNIGGWNTVGLVRIWHWRWNTKIEKNQDFNHNIAMRQVWLWAVFVGLSSQPNIGGWNTVGLVRNWLWRWGVLKLEKIKILTIRLQWDRYDCELYL